MLRALFWVVVVLALGACSRDAPPPAAVAGQARAPDVVRREGNHLATSDSAYLKTHGHDPVDWYPWGPEALGRAKAENKPIFLSIGYVACHWCHVMQHEVFSQDDVATVLNERFISIKVDREERPDIDRIYMDALEAMGRSGGWPATLFLTPALEPFFGATYIEKARFLDIAKEAATAYTSGDPELKKRTNAFRESLAVKAPEGAGNAVTLEEIHIAATAALDRVDLARGGFKGTTKFPLASRWRFLLHAYRKWGDDGIEKALQKTLDAMAMGALHDPVRGGFHRYTVDPAWTTPHYEEMLYDNAQLASLYLEAGAVLHVDGFVRAWTEALDFIVDELTTSSGAFAASFDADFQGIEGVAWTWSRAELDAVLPKDQSEIVAALLEIPSGAPRAPRRIPSSEVASRLNRPNLTAKTVDGVWASAQPELRKARSGKANRDDKIVTSWNGLAITALVQGSAFSGGAHWREAAQRAGEHLWRAHHETPGHLVHTSSTPPSPAVLEDYACLAEAYVTLFEATSDVMWLDRATQLVKEAVAQLGAPTGAFYASEVPAPFVRTVSLDDNAEPSGNAVMLHVLLRLSSLGARGADWQGMATRMLTSYAGPMRERGVGMAGWLDAALLDRGPSYDLVIAGSPSVRPPLEMVVVPLMAPWISRINVPAAGAEGAMKDRLDALDGKTSGTASLRAFVCERGACKKPTADPTELDAQLRAGWKR